VPVGPGESGQLLDRPLSVVVLAVVALASSAVSLLAAVRPLSPDSPVVLDAVVAGYALLVAIGLWWAGPRTPVLALHVVLASAIVVISVAIAQSATQHGAVSTAFAYVWIGLYASYFFPTRAATGYLVAIALGFSGGAALNGFTLRPVVWILVISTVLGTSGVLVVLLARLRRLADTDQLTGVLNRRGLRSAAEPMLALASRAGRPVTLIGIDLDDFKQVNDSGGHSAGDALLRELTAAWRTRLRQGELLGRHGGDEFVLLLPGTEGDARVLVDRLRRAHPAAWSAGIVEARVGEVLDDLLRTADRAMYDVKSRRRGRSGRVREAALSPL
jgi:diguanylate cyclase (GGDEF)-like protein